MPQAMQQEQKEVLKTGLVIQEQKQIRQNDENRAAPNEEAHFRLQLSGQTVWATQRELKELKDNEIREAIHIPEFEVKGLRERLMTMSPRERKAYNERKKRYKQDLAYYQKTYEEPYKKAHYGRTPLEDEMTRTTKYLDVLKERRKYERYGGDVPDDSKAMMNQLKNVKNQQKLIHGMVSQTGKALKLTSKKAFPNDNVERMKSTKYCKAPTDIVTSMAVSKWKIGAMFGGISSMQVADYINQNGHAIIETDTMLKTRGTSKIDDNEFEIVLNVKKGTPAAAVANPREGDKLLLPPRTAMKLLKIEPTGVDHPQYRLFMKTVLQEDLNGELKKAKKEKAAILEQEKKKEAARALGKKFTAKVNQHISQKGMTREEYLDHMWQVKEERARKIEEAKKRRAAKG